jgi:hypothetical protein
MIKTVLVICFIAATVLIVGCSGERSESASSSAEAVDETSGESDEGISQEDAGSDAFAPDESGVSDLGSSDASGTGETAAETSGDAAGTVSEQTTGESEDPEGAIDARGTDETVPLEMTPAEETAAASQPDVPGQETDYVSPSGLSVIRAYICKGIEQSEPTEAGKSFLPEGDGVGRLCCFSEIGGAGEPDTISHVWYWGERDMGRVPLEVRSSRWRTWSKKKVLDEWRGEWHVDIVDRDGFLLTRLYFSIE